MAEGKTGAKDLWRTEWAPFARAKDTCDVRGMADVLLHEYGRLLAGGAHAWEATPLASVDVLLFACRAALHVGDTARAMAYAEAFYRINIACHRKMWTDVAKWGGIAAYQAGDAREALRWFDLLAGTSVEDAEMELYRGNALFRLGRLQEAQTAYVAAMKFAGVDAVAAHNLALTLGPAMQTGDARLDPALASFSWADELREPQPHAIPAMELHETFDLPIFINCRDRVAMLRRLVDWLLAAGYHNLFLIDNASTYPPLLAYYDEIVNHPCVTLLKLSHNLGHRALWRAHILTELDIRTPFVYTDPDVLPVERCPAGLVARLYQILRRYPFLDKVGPGLQVDDLSAQSTDAYQREEITYCQVPVEEELYFAPCDTTFALYAPRASYTIGMSMRTRGNLLLRHLPWYLDPAHLPEDEAYYIAHADASSTFAAAVQKQDN
ncbi:hypothetical protein [Selenomonas sp.]|uniref:hypothetical protein n=1 Tax=Selenomonas sp. TaxID=2053611 RepID=UPI0025EF1298|nr:hypothetical protein [Selenomonas sp.]MCI6282957.1 hypothetical protein [Selenomonas sp.]